MINDAHSYYRHELRMVKRSIGTPPKDEHTERVPYSSVTYDFDEVLGSSYGERTLTYQLEFLCFHREIAAKKTVNILKWLHFSGKQELYDDMLPGYHFLVREPVVSFSENNGVYTFSLTFKAAPEILPDISTPEPEPEPEDYRFPDVNGDGYVDARDSSLIMSAYSNLMSDLPSGLTKEQEIRADANRDGRIDARDSSLVLNFYACLMDGQYECTREDWERYLKENGVIE